MSRYVQTEQDIYSIFALPEWASEGVPTYPAEYIPPVNNTEYLRITIIPSETGLNAGSTSGIMMIDIFFPANVGSRRGFELADLLDDYLVKKTILTTQIFDSTLRPASSEDSTLSRLIYSIPFKHFGEQL